MDPHMLAPAIRISAGAALFLDALYGFRFRRPTVNPEAGSVTGLARLVLILQAGIGAALLLPFPWADHLGISLFVVTVAVIILACYRTVHIARRIRGGKARD